MKKIYIVPAVDVFRTEAMDYMAMSIDTSKVEWEDDVVFEVKEDKGKDSFWDNEW